MAIENTAFEANVLTEKYSVAEPTLPAVSFA